MKPKRANSGGPLDECYTPGYAVDELCTFLPAGATIWEPAASEAQRLANLLAQRGFAVITSTLSQGADFCRVCPIEPFDYIITNGPFSKKRAFVERCEYFWRTSGIPYALLWPIETLGLKWMADMFPEGDFEELFFNRRIHFQMPGRGDPLVFTPGDAWYEWQWGDPPSITPHARSSSSIKHQAQFPVFWLCRGILGRPRHYAQVHYYCDVALTPPRQAPRPAQLRFQDQHVLPFAA